MTTDRTAAARPAALADRPALSDRGRRADAFSALLDAAAPKGDAQASRTAAHRHDDGPRDVRSREDGPHGAGRRPDEQHPERDDAATREDGPRGAARRPDERDDSPAREDGPRGADRGPQPGDAAGGGAPAPTTDAAPACEPSPAAPAAASFVLQLASPLSPATSPASPAVAPIAPSPGSPPAAAVQDTPVTSVLSGLVPAFVTAAAVPPATEAASGEAAIAIPGLPVATEPAADETGEQAPQAPARGDALPARTASQPDTPEQPIAPAPTRVAAQAESAEPVTAQSAAATPTAPASPAAPAASPLGHVERAVPLSRAIPTTGVLIQLAAERGITHARLNLKPAELGGIEVKLQTTPAGIHAQLVADSPEAARMLAQAGDDLRRQLEARDVNLLSLDVSTSHDQRHDQPGFNPHGFGDDHRPGGYPPSFRGDAVLMEMPLAADTVLVLPDGVHVDVLA